MLASTGGGRSTSQPIAALTSVRLCAAVNAVMVQNSCAEGHQEQQAAYEQQVVVAGEDVFDAEHDVGGGDLPPGAAVFG